MKTEGGSSRRKQLTYYKAIAIGVLVYWLALLALVYFLSYDSDANDYWMNAVNYGLAMGIVIPIGLFLIVKLNIFKSKRIS